METYVCVRGGVTITRASGEALLLTKSQAVHPDHTGYAMALVEEGLLAEMRKRNLLWGCAIGTLNITTEACFGFDPGYEDAP